MKTVTIYTTPTCPYCKLEKAYLTEKGINFTEIDASQPARAKEMVEKSGQMGVPVTVVSDAKGKEDIIVGFDQAMLNKLLDIR